MKTETDFDDEFSVDELTKIIVDKAKADVKSKYGNRKRHKQ
jgi:hypothetical protein